MGRPICRREGRDGHDQWSRGDVGGRKRIVLRKSGFPNAVFEIRRRGHGVGVREERRWGTGDGGGGQGRRSGSGGIFSSSPVNVDNWRVPNFVFVFANLAGVEGYERALVSGFIVAIGADVG